MRTLLIILFMLSSCLALKAQKSCGSDAYQQLIRKQFPNTIYHNGISLNASAQEASSAVFDEGQTVTIPVVVHVLYQSSVSEISDFTVQQQLDILNRDFNLGDPAVAAVPQMFARVAGIANIRFQLARVDPEGRATTGINRKKSSRLLWGNDDKIKDPAYGGVEPWDSRYYLNIWVSNLVPGLLGYASAPGSPANRDGVVISAGVFGEAGGSFSKGRTTVHEVGHWLNLKHLWGESNCGSDEVEDTPPQKTYNQGCPGFPKLNNACGTDGNGEMYMNFMDFTDDACMVMFTKGQVARMRAIFFSGGVRASVWQSRALGAPWNNGSPVLINEPMEVAAVVTAHPMPAVASLVLKSKQGSLQNVAFAMYSADGRVVMKGRLTGENPGIQVAALKAGVYFIRLEGFEKAVRILKQ